MRARTAEKVRATPRTSLNGTPRDSIILSISIPTAPEPHQRARGVEEVLRPRRDPRPPGDICDSNRHFVRPRVQEVCAPEAPATARLGTAIPFLLLNARQPRPTRACERWRSAAESIAARGDAGLGVVARDRRGRRRKKHLTVGRVGCTQKWRLLMNSDFLRGIKGQSRAADRDATPSTTPSRACNWPARCTLCGGMMAMTLARSLLVLALLAPDSALAASAETCVRTGSSPKCEGDCCGTFPCVVVPMRMRS